MNVASVPSVATAAPKAPVAELALTSRSGTERVSVEVASKGQVRLGAASVADAARAAQDIMPMGSSWAVMREADGSRFVAPLVESDGSRAPNIDAEIFSSASLVSASDALEAIVGYRTVLVP